MWKGLEEQAREALSSAAQKVGDVEAAEGEASTKRVQADIAERCAASESEEFLLGERWLSWRLSEAWLQLTCSDLAPD